MYKYGTHTLHGSYSTRVDPIGSGEKGQSLQWNHTTQSRVVLYWVRDSGIGWFLCAAGRGQEEIYGDGWLVAVCCIDLSLLGVSLQEEMIMVRQTKHM